MLISYGYCEWNSIVAGIELLFHPFTLLLSECYEDFENLLNRIFIDPSPSVSDSENWQMNRPRRDNIVALITSGVVRLFSVLGAVPERGTDVFYTTPWLG